MFILVVVRTLRFGRRESVSGSAVVLMAINRHCLLVWLFHINPVALARKKTGEAELVVDYRGKQTSKR